ncbi:MAG: hypothetical protein FJZ64_02460, partial [Chlamydiae bacterium]|nr:hypothetical protein [Chlamydiota bacterium]
KKIRDADFEGQVKALAKPSSQTFRILLKEKGSLFFFLSPENKKVKATAALPPFFQWALENLLPIIAQGMNPKTLLGSLQSAFETYAKNVLAEEQTIDPDEILKKMRAAIEQEEFASRIQGKYRAAIIDEFQDTDPLQWEIFKTLFLSPSSNLRAFYLVGDPKQSIYRFRSADVYTYFEAKKILGSDALFSLDTNFRSSSSLIDALNALFYRNWLPLPKIGEQIPCPPVKAGQKEPLKIADGKEAIHFLIGDSFEESFLPFTVLEIEKLLPKFSPTSFAILVRDRYGMDLALKALERRSIPAIAKSNTSLSETLGFQAVKEFFMALVYPKDMSLKRRVAMGPFANIPQDVSLNFIELCRFFPTSFEGTKEILEILLIWEGKEGYSPQKLLQFLEDFAKLEPEEGNVRQIDTEKEAVQIMTLHASKGLEFDVVFALGLSVRPPKTEDDEIVEMEAEKLRQLYVAMTRAKSRLYVPLPLERSKGRGSFSAAESFCQTLISQEGDLVSFLERTKNVSYEKLPAQIPLSLVPKKNVEELPLSSFSIPSFSPSFLHSFTSLSRPEVSELHFNQNPLFTPHTIPPGTEIGILVHKVFERLFSSVRNDPIAVNQVVLEEVEATSFLPWKEAISEMIWKTLCLPLPFGCSLKDLQVDQVQAEMEFFFSDSPHFIKGFIDLVFLHEEKLYFVDWKTNWLGNDDLAYQSLEKVMTEHDYWLQAKLYKEALKRNVKRFYTRPFDEIFGGAIYLFVRGGGICHFNPN